MVSTAKPMLDFNDKKALFLLLQQGILDFETRLTKRRTLLNLSVQGLRKLLKEMIKVVDVLSINMSRVIDIHVK